MSYDYWAKQLNILAGEGLLRQLRAVESAADTTLRIDGQEKVVFCSNNYLGLATDARIIEAATEGLRLWGAGVGASRLISGTTRAHVSLERRLAGLVGKEAALVMSSGYAANHAVLTTLPGRGDLIVADKLVHASIIDAGQASRATMRVWPHGDTKKLRRLLERGNYRRAFIVTDSLFSMDGDFAPLAELVELKRQFDAVLIVDEAHAFGCVGPGGRGYAAEQGLIEQVDLLVVTLSKAIGTAGGAVLGPRVLIDTLVNRARGFIFTTALPAVNCVAAEAALDVIETEPQRRERLLDNGDYLRARCSELRLDCGLSESYIVPVVLGCPQKTMAVAAELFEQGFIVGAIRPPTVAPGGSRLRVSLMSEHSRDDIDGLIAAMKATLCQK